MKEEIKKEIVNLLSDKKARDTIEIIKCLNYSKDMDSLIIDTIREMTMEYDLYMTKHGRYMNFEDSEIARNMYKGIFDATKGEYGFVIVANLEDDIFIPSNYKNGAMDGDLVLVNVIKGKSNTNKCEGKVIKVLKRNIKTKIAEVCIDNGV